MKQVVQAYIEAPAVPWNVVPSSAAADRENHYYLGYDHQPDRHYCSSDYLPGWNSDNERKKEYHHQYSKILESWIDLVVGADESQFL